MNISDFAVSAFLHYRVGHGHRKRDFVTYYRFPDLQSRCIEGSELPECDPDHIRIVVVADTHNRHANLDFLPPCDILVHCGDILMTGRMLSFDAQKQIMESFDEWMGTTLSKKRIFVAGNHDHILCHHLSSKEERKRLFHNVEYLENDVVQAEGLTMYATPLSVGASKNRAFQSSEFLTDSVEKANSVQNQMKEVDILLTHGFGSGIAELIPHNLHLCGHFHEMYGVKVISVLEEYECGVWVERILKHRKSSYSASHYDNDPRYGIRTGRVVAKQVRICAPICDGDYVLSNPPIVVDYPRPRASRK